MPTTEYIPSGRSPREIYSVVGIKHGLTILAPGFGAQVNANTRRYSRYFRSSHNWEKALRNLLFSWNLRRHFEQTHFWQQHPTSQRWRESEMNKRCYIRSTRVLVIKHSWADEHNMLSLFLVISMELGLYICFICILLSNKIPCFLAIQILIYKRTSVYKF